MMPSDSGQVLRVQGTYVCVLLVLLVLLVLVDIAEDCPAIGRMEMALIIPLHGRLRQSAKSAPFIRPARPVALKYAYAARGINLFMIEHVDKTGIASASKTEMVSTHLMAMGTFHVLPTPLPNHCSIPPSSTNTELSSTDR